MYNYNIKIDDSTHHSLPYLLKMAKILLIGQPVRDIEVEREKSIIHHLDFEKSNVRTYTYDSKKGKGVIVSYISKYNDDKFPNGERENIFFPTDTKLINQALRSIEKFEDKANPDIKIPSPSLPKMDMLGYDIIY